LRNLFNRLVGQMHHCLQHGERYDEEGAFPARPDAPDSTAA
jgi:hypothetical protein